MISLAFVARVHFVRVASHSWTSRKELLPSWDRRSSRCRFANAERPYETGFAKPSFLATMASAAVSA